MSVAKKGSGMFLSVIKVSQGKDRFIKCTIILARLNYQISIYLKATGLRDVKSR